MYNAERIRPHCGQHCGLPNKMDLGDRPRTKIVYVYNTSKLTEAINLNILTNINNFGPQ